MTTATELRTGPKPDYTAVNAEGNLMGPMGSLGHRIKFENMLPSNVVISAEPYPDEFFKRSHAPTWEAIADLRVENAGMRAVFALEATGQGQRVLTISEIEQNRFELNESDRDINAYEREGVRHGYFAAREDLPTATEDWQRKGEEMSNLRAGMSLVAQQPFAVAGTVTFDVPGYTAEGYVNGPAPAEVTTEQEAASAAKVASNRARFPELYVPANDDPELDSEGSYSL